MREPLEEGVPNLDCMSSEELYDFAAKTQGVHPKRAARQMFPDNPIGRVKATKNLHHYAMNKVTAIACRIRGDIQTAVHYENICERLYEQLPEWARW